MIPMIKAKDNNNSSNGRTRLATAVNTDLFFMRVSIYWGDNLSQV